MAVRVVITRGSNGQALGEEVHQRGVTYTVNQGLLVILDGKGQFSEHVATYAPGSWSSVHIEPSDESSSGA